MKKKSKKKVSPDYGLVQTTDGLGNTETCTFPERGIYSYGRSALKTVFESSPLPTSPYCCGDPEPHGHQANNLLDTRLNRLETYDGTAELRLKLKNSLDCISWENNGETITGKAEKLRFIVYVGDEDSYVGIYEKPFLGDAQLVRHLDIDNSLYEKIALRASTSVPNRRLLKALTTL